MLGMRERIKSLRGRLNIRSNRRWHETSGLRIDWRILSWKWVANNYICRLPAVSRGGASRRS